MNVHLQVQSTVNLIKLVLDWVLNHNYSICRELIAATLNHMRNGLKSVFGRLRKNEDRKLVAKWSKCKEGRCLISTTQSRKNITAECTGYECV